MFPLTRGIKFFHVMALSWFLLYKKHHSKFHCVIISTVKIVIQNIVRFLGCENVM